ncbi:hypothetical protein KSS87_000400 [Heliosperma pusillum]|nr:hypothetical protein KSS87_000400 [Heliosperma pusillum]
METGSIVVSKISGKSTVTRCFSKYPLKLIVPNKACSRDVDCAWIYTLTYGGGIVSGDSILCNFIVEDGCTAVLTTQASTKVYKSIGSKCSEQILEALVGHEALLVVIPDPVTCFSAARYSQKQVFRVSSNSNLLLVDWFTSGRYESGERWEFELYRSTNNIYEDDQPLFLDTVLLEQGNISSITERMHDYQIIAMVIILGYIKVKEWKVTLDSLTLDTVNWNETAWLEGNSGKYLDKIYLLIIVYLCLNIGEPPTFWQDAFDKHPASSNS